jgi:hypothetical protein
MLNVIQEGRIRISYWLHIRITYSGSDQTKEFRIRIHKKLKVDANNKIIFDEVPVPVPYTCTEETIAMIRVSRDRNRFSQGETKNYALAFTSLKRYPVVLGPYIGLRKKKQVLG